MLARRGRFGLLVSRGFADKELFLKRCRDTLRKDDKLLVPLHDDDLRRLAAPGTDPGLDPMAGSVLDEMVARVCA